MTRICRPSLHRRRRARAGRRDGLAGHGRHIPGCHARALARPEGISPSPSSFLMCTARMGKANGKRRTPLPSPGLMALTARHALPRCVLTHGRPSPRPANFRRVLAVGLLKAVKDAEQQFGTDALSVVAHLDLKTGVVAAQCDVDSSSLGVNLTAFETRFPYDLLDAHTVTRGSACPPGRAVRPP